MSIISKRSKVIKAIVIIQTIAVIGILSLSAASCKWTIGLVRGSGNIEKEERDVSGFDEVSFSGMGTLIITQGEEESLVVEADDNILPLIETNVFGGSLIIGYKWGYNVIPATNIKFYLSVDDLSKISLSGAGKIECSNLETDKLEVELSGAGDIDFDIDADELVITSAGAGDLTLSGEVEKQSVDISGVGRYNAKELESEECDIKVSGAGSATLNVAGELDIDISGVGNVYYIGNPRVKQDISGLGKVESID
jgi:hypothetical protein